MKKILDSEPGDLFLNLNKKIEKMNFIIEKSLLISQRPFVSYSGGLHSNVLFYFIKQLKTDTGAFFLDLRLHYPTTIEWLNKFLSQHQNIYTFRSPYSEKEFINKYGLPIFDGLKEVISKKDYKKYKITDYCQNLREKLKNKAYQTLKPDLVFLGILADEKPKRKKAWLENGYIYLNTKGIKISTPLAHFSKKDIEKLIERYDIDFPIKSYRDRQTSRIIQGDLGCWMCSARCLERGINGNWQFLYRNYPQLWQKLIDSYGVGKILNTIYQRTKNQKLKNFLASHKLLN